MPQLKFFMSLLTLFSGSAIDDVDRGLKHSRHFWINKCVDLKLIIFAINLNAM